MWIRKLENIVIEDKKIYAILYLIIYDKIIIIDIKCCAKLEHKLFYVINKILLMYCN